MYAIRGFRMNVMKSLKMLLELEGRVQLGSI